MLRLPIQPIHWKPMPPHDWPGSGVYGARTVSDFTLDGNTYTQIIRLWNSANIRETDELSDQFYVAEEKQDPDDSHKSNPHQGTLAEVLAKAHELYDAWVAYHNHRRFQLTAFAVQLNKLDALNHSDSEEE